jgi:hypothetical protein
MQELLEIKRKSFPWNIQAYCSRTIFATRHAKEENMYSMQDFLRQTVVQVIYHLHGNTIQIVLYKIQ